ncbi:MAG TPA: carboxylating nicotinate-nucleotide diphosphorylase [Steroidobacteraceae bacterium]|nr:carboxylating nicotinate-nucleotide diphosphorylase [Steroidobacteraceae bacterium]
MNRPIPLPEDVAATVARALAEDVGTGDLTASLIPAEKAGNAHVISREPATLCGCAWFDEVFRQLDATTRIEWFANDGDRISSNQTICRLQGPARNLLTGERTALNFVQSLSGTATATRQYVDAISGTNCRILDTRKTIPGLRLAQKYAVRCGGGTNHRIGLFDALLVKENHIIAAGSIAAAVAQARKIAGKRMVEMEVENLDELQQALATDIDRILLDNFTNADMAQGVKINQARAGKKIELEASGNVTLESIRAIAATGVDYMSVGALTKHIRAIDLSMRFE